MLGAVFIGLLACDGCFHGINYGLPLYISPLNFGLVDFFYRILRIVAPFFLLYSLTIFNWHRPSVLVGGLLYLVAYGVKKLAWHLSYKEELEWDD